MRAAILLGATLLGLGCGSAQVGSSDKPGRERDVAFTHDPCDTESSSAKRIDLNGDGRPDLVQVFEGGREVCRAVDLNFDGRVDTFVYYDAAGLERRRESDFDRDGRPDEIAIYQAGVPVLKMRETNFDGQIDTWDTYEAGRLVRRERDSTGDRIVDQWWEFNPNDPNCATVSVDRRGDGRPDIDSSVDLCADKAAALPPPPPASEGPPGAATPGPATPGAATPTDAASDTYGDASPGAPPSKP